MCEIESNILFPKEHINSLCQIVALDAFEKPENPDELPEWEKTISEVVNILQCYVIDVDSMHTSTFKPTDVAEDSAILPLLSRLKERADAGLAAAYKERFTKEEDEDGNLVDVEIILNSERRYASARARYIEGAAIGAGLVGTRGETTRCSSHAIESFLEKKEKTDTWANGQVITNGTTKFKLDDSSKKSIKKTAETLAILNGIMKVAQSQKKIFASIVCTVPASYHALPKDPNSKTVWNRKLPNESRDLLQKNWVRVRTELSNQGIVLSGVSTLEAHQDGTAHRNFVVYFDMKDTVLVEDTFRKHFQHSGNAVTFTLGRDAASKKNGEKIANFATYAFKYILKYGLKEAEIGSEKHKAATAEATWASLWGIRRYSFMGIPPLGLWRTMRASKFEPQDQNLKALWTACRTGDFATFISLNGGLNARKSRHQFETIKDGGTVVGVSHKASGAMHITKIAGQYRIEKQTGLITAALEKVAEEKNITVNEHIKIVMEERKKNDEENSQNKNQKSTLKVIYPRGLANEKHTPENEKMRENHETLIERGRLKQEERQKATVKEKQEQLNRDAIENAGRFIAQLRGSATFESLST